MVKTWKEMGLADENGNITVPKGESMALQPDQEEYKETHGNWSKPLQFPLGQVETDTPDLQAILNKIQPTTDPYEETMMLLRFKVYDLISEHMPDRNICLKLKKLVELTFQ